MRTKISEVELLENRAPSVRRSYGSEVAHIVTHHVKGDHRITPTKCNRLLEGVMDVTDMTGWRLCGRCGDQTAFNEAHRLMRESRARWRQELEEKQQREAKAREATWQAERDRLAILADSLRANGFDVDEKNVLSYQGFRYEIKEAE